MPASTTRRAALARAQMTEPPDPGPILEKVSAWQVKQTGRDRVKVTLTYQGPEEKMTRRVP